MLSRRLFLRLSAAGAATVAVAFGLWEKCLRIHGQMLGPAADIGHILRGDLTRVPAPSSEEEIPIVIVGGGVAGLSAAWHLHHLGFSDFKLFELDREVGGTSLSGENEVSPFPWGAHYLPIPSHESKELQDLLKEMGVITGNDEEGYPIYNEAYLCYEPQERFKFKGRWYSGSIPDVDNGPNDRKHIRAFGKKMLGLRAQKGKDGRRLFAIPIEKSSRDPEWIRLDSISMKEYLAEQGFTSERLHWYVNYCCRDDFGTTYDQTSAWAGIHYFAARGGESANVNPNGLLTWPEGNGWLVNRLREKSVTQITTDALVTTVRPTAGGAEVDVYFPKENKTKRIRTKAVIFAAPRFVAAKVIEPWRKNPPAHIAAFQYTPWMVANARLKGLPKASFDDADLAWDNNMVESDSMGYVVATHQMRLKNTDHDTNITLYWPLSDLPPKDARNLARSRDYKAWAKIAMDELEKMHPGIRSQVRNLDVCVWGHGMIRAVPGFMWGKDRLAAVEPFGKIFFSHTDTSGMSLFEEAHYRGVTAATAALETLKS